MAKNVLKILCVFFLLPVLLLNGCSSSQNTKNALTNFTADFSACYKNMNIKGTLSRTRQGITNINITYPKTLNGLNVGYKNNQVYVMRENLQCTADEAYLPCDSFPCVVNSILEGVSDGRTKLFVKSETEDTYSLETGSGSCSVAIDKNGKIEKAEIKDINFVMTFSNVKPK